MTSLEECQGCGKEGVMGFCDNCELHGASKDSGLGIAGIAFARATSIGLANYADTCQCTTCRIHKAMSRSDGKPWKCLKPKSVGPNGFFCSECMVEMSYNSYLDKYTYDDETKPVIAEAVRRSKEGDVQSFLADVTDVTNKSDDNVICALLYDTYSKYCEDNFLTPKSYVEFGGELSRLGLDKRRKTENWRQSWVYQGLKLKEIV
jgi:hypothetical protein